MADTFARAVRFDRYGARDVLYIPELPMPVPQAGEVVVAVRATGINPGETAIRTGRSTRASRRRPLGRGQRSVRRRHRRR